MIWHFMLPAFALLLGCATADAGGGMSRRLEYADIVGFTPLTDVRDQLRIDLDQQKIEELLENENFAVAQSMYQEGSHSKTVSNLTISDGLPVEIPQGTVLIGGSGNGTDTKASPIEVFAYGAEGYPAGATSIIVQYINENCYVGANPDPRSSGLPETGNLQTRDGATTFDYSYNVADTSNVYSIQLFTDSGEFSFEGNALTADFQKFVDFYESESYADDIIQAALAGKATNFPSGKNLDTSSYDFEARGEVVAKASAYMAVWMYVIRELEHAIFLCQTGSCDENSCLGKPPVHEVDEAVAFYAGSLEGTDGSGTGVLTYNLADIRAQDFKTAGENGDSVEGTAKVNLDLLETFKQMSENIVAAKCDAGREDTTRIVQLMTVPLIQGTLRYAYFTGMQGDETHKSEAEGAIFAASVLPFVANCNKDDADIIYDNMKTGQKASADFAAVKAAFERNYDCMGITAADVGGLWDAENDKYFEGAEPAGISGTDGTDGTDTSGSLPFSAGVATGVSMLFLVLNFIFI